MRPFFLVGLSIALGACTGGTQPKPGPAPFAVNCTAGVATPDAKVTAGRQTDGSVILPGGRRIKPAGKVIDVGGFPVALRILPGDRYVVVTDDDYGDEALRIVDLQAADPKNAVVSHADYPATTDSPHDPALFYGLALTKSGKRLYVSNGGSDPVDASVPLIGHYNPIDVYNLSGTPPQLQKDSTSPIKLYFNPGSSMNGSATQRLPSGLTLSSDEMTLYVAGQGDGTLAIVDLHPGMGFGAEIGRAILPGNAPYDVVVDESSHTAYLSLWGGAGVAAVDVTDKARPVPMMAPILTGKAAEAELFLGGKLWVANADADDISQYDVKTKMVQHLRTTTGGLLGSSPNNLYIDAASHRLYVANAGENAVQVFDLDTLAAKGRIPTAWYPTAVATLGDGTVIIASAKGLGIGPSNVDHGKNDYMQGVLQVVPKPSDAELAAGDMAVAQNLGRPQSYQVPLTCPPSGEKHFPLPPAPGAPTPIQHVFLIVRENKTYDAVLGDAATGNGDPKLVLFGASITPNLHALAKTFTNLDNFYSNAEQSLQGHEWTTAGVANDYVEKGWSSTWGRAYRTVAAFAAGPAERLAHPGSDTIWSHLDKAKMAYHNYGEITNTQGAFHVYDTSYPGVFFSLLRKDVEKIQYVIDTVKDPTFTVEPFSYVSLPNDHTYGTTPGKPTPQSMVADNDEATGRFVDALSHSPLWASSIVFVIEDDPHDGGDHVEGHRSPCVVISPWVKRGNVSSVNYDVPALLHTITLLLNVPPLNQNDANAATMYDLFATTADMTPFTFQPRTVPEGTNSVDAPLSDLSSQIDFSRPDSAPLGRILWKAMRGTNAEPPWGATDSPRRHRRDDDD